MLFGSTGNEEEQEEPEEVRSGFAERARKIKSSWLPASWRMTSLRLKSRTLRRTCWICLPVKAMTGMGMNMQEMFGQLHAETYEETQAACQGSRKVLTQEEANKLIDMDDVIPESVTPSGAVRHYFHR